MKFKTPEVEQRFKDMNITAQKIAKEMYSWLKENYDIEMVITTTVSTAAEDKELSRISDTHRTRRAFDVRTYNIPEEIIQKLIEVFNTRYGKFGAVASVKPQLIINKSHGSGPHLHVQLNRKYALKEIDYGKN